MTIRRYDKNYRSVSIITDDDDQEELAFCEVCQKNGELSKLKERIYLDNNGKLLPPPPDADSFRQCWTCGTVVIYRDVKLSGTITGINGISPVDNPFDEKKGMVLGLDDMGSVKKRYSRLRKRQTKHEDKEVQAHIDQGYELISYQNDEPTSLSSTSYFSQ
jgi:hypothetical protein